jgi:CPA2 family monovalent cation:H+ antiporter-2
LVTIIGKATFSSLGVLLSGQPLKVSIQSGFSLAQIGEFAFIIAALGLSLGVMSDFIYPIIIAVSVITTFTSPYFIRFANPFYEWLNPRIPVKIKAILDNYASGGDIAKNESDWKKFMKKYIINVLIYGVLSVAVILCFVYIISPFVTVKLQALHVPVVWINIINSLTTIVVMLPFLMGLMMTNRNTKTLEATLTANNNTVNRRRLTVLVLFRVFLAIFLTTLVLFIHFRSTHAVLPVIFITASVVVFLIFARKNFKLHWYIEDRFLENLNQKEELERQKSPLRSSINAQMSHSDVHLAEITVSPDSPFVGKSLLELNVRKNYNVNIAKIVRGHTMIYFPSANDYIYPFDQLVTIGTDEHIAEFTQIMEVQTDHALQPSKEKDIELTSFVISTQSPLYGKTLMESDLRSAGCLVIEVDRAGEHIINPGTHFRFAEGDLVWIAGIKTSVGRFV